MRHPITVDFFEQRKHSLLNMLHTWLLVAGSLLLLTVCAWLLMGVIGILYAFIFGAISLYIASRVSPSLVLKMYMAKPVSRLQFPTGHAILDDLVERAGLEHRPTLNIVPSQMMNAFAVGKTSDSAIALTDQLVRNLTRRELAGVMAHEMAHIKNEDVKVMAISDVVSRFTSVLSTFGIFTMLFNLPSIFIGGTVTFPWFAVLILIAAPTIGGLLQMALSRAREFDADLGAVLLTGDPDGLASALVKLEKIQGRRWESLVLPGSRLPEPSILRTHPKTEDRVRRLLSLKNEATGEFPHLKKTSRSKPITPRIPRRWSRGYSDDIFALSHLIQSGEIPDINEVEVAEQPACSEALNFPDSRPRIRIIRGGVWW